MQSKQIVLRRPLKDANNVCTQFGMTGFEVASKHYSEHASTKEPIWKKTTSLHTRDGRRCGLTA